MLDVDTAPKRGSSLGPRKSIRLLTHPELEITPGSIHDLLGFLDVRCSLGFALSQLGLRQPRPLGSEVAQPNWLKDACDRKKSSSTHVDGSFLADSTHDHGGDVSHQQKPCSYTLSLSLRAARVPIRATLYYNGTPKQYWSLVKPLY